MFLNKVAWVTGASSGIGFEIVKQLDLAGAKVIISSRNYDQLESIRLKLKNPEKHFVLALDLEKSNEFEYLATQVINKYGIIDFLFNNGGLSQRSNARDTPLEVDRRIMEINYFGNIALTKAVLPYMRNKKNGHIIVISSIVGKFGFFLRSSYSASKHALHGFYESLLLEEEENRLKVTIVCPGKIKTNISLNALNSDGLKHGVMDNNQHGGMSVDDCVHKILNAVIKNKKEIFIGNKEIKAVTLKKFFPKLFWKVIRKQSSK
ncbi:MAG: short chain dehydrogenase [Crocinitomicaceae bacterium]|nr:short chain dehydrogenase [Crocinitomicaceae bacterium]|tara:strand:- start:35319 stop:36107 length:789 start_codon:yes stop_codon:yes gene_type:complete